LYFWQPYRTIIRIYPLSRKSLTLVVALVLSLGAFILSAEEAQAQQQPPQPARAKQFSATASAEYSAAADKGVAKEPVAKVPSVVSPTVELPLPMKPRQSISSAPEPAPKVKLEPAADPLLNPVAHQPPNPTLLEDPKKPTPEPASEPGALQESGPLPTPDQEGTAARNEGLVTLPSEDGLGLAAPLPKKNVSTNSTALIAPFNAPSFPHTAHKSSVPKLSVPVWAGGGGPSHISSGLEGALRTSANGTPEPSSNNGVQTPGQGTPQPQQHQQQPSAPLLPPMSDNYSLFFLAGSAGGGGIPISGGVGLTLLGLLCILASGLFLLRPNGKLYLIYCALFQKPSSVLLLPLERPG
jgi:hypothetical protein